MKKKILSIFLCMAMVIAMTPSMVFAMATPAWTEDAAGVVTLSANTLGVDVTDFTSSTLKKINLNGNTLTATASLPAVCEAKIDAAAKINKSLLQVVYYDTLAAANKAAEYGDELVLLKNYTGDPLLVNPGKDTSSPAKSIKLNKNGFTNANINYAPVTITGLFDKNGTVKDFDATSAERNVGKNFTAKPVLSELCFSSVEEALSVANKAAELKTGIGNTDNTVSIKLWENVEENIVIEAYQNIDLDLNGKTLTGNITNDGILNIKDSSFVNSPDPKVPMSKFTFGNGKVTGEIVDRSDGKLTFESGKFIPSQQNIGEGKLKSGSSSALINGEWIVMPNGMSLDFTLKYKIFNKGDDISVLANAIDPETISQEFELAADKDYTAVIYMDAPVDDISVRTFDFTALYDDSIMTVNNHVDTGLSKYDQVDRSVDGELNYTLSKNNYTFKQGEYKNAIAAFDFKVNANKVNVDELFSFDFGRSNNGYNAYVSTMDLINEIPLKFADPFEARIVNKLNGVNVVDYIYAPEGYKLAIIAADHGNKFTTTLSEQKLGENVPVYFTSNPAYIAQSTNPDGKDIAGNKGQLKGVYLALVKQNSASETAASMEKRVKEALINAEGLDTPIEACMFTGNINNDTVTDYNDASIVYQMLKANTHWGYDPVNSNTYIGSLKRLLCEGNQDGKLYGTIEDVNFILDLITNNGTYSY